MINIENNQKKAYKEFIKQIYSSQLRSKKMELVFLSIAILFLLTIALNTSFDVQAKVPDLDRNKIAKIINATEFKLYQNNEASPNRLKKYKWIDFDDNKGKIKNVYELWYYDADKNPYYVYYTINKKNKAKLVKFDGNKTLDQWGYKFKEWSNKK